VVSLGLGRACARACGWSAWVMGVRVRVRVGNARVCACSMTPQPPSILIFCFPAAVLQAIRYDDGRDGPVRVWLRDDEVPGLAMSRSLGDSIGKEAGVVSTPQLHWYTLCPADAFLILGSDGLWEFTPNADVAAVVQVRQQDEEEEGGDDALLPLVPWPPNPHTPFLLLVLPCRLRTSRPPSQQPRTKRRLLPLLRVARLTLLATPPSSTYSSPSTGSLTLLGRAGRSERESSTTSPSSLQR
jgi:hypothetical protein